MYNILGISFNQSEKYTRILSAVFHQVIRLIWYIVLSQDLSTPHVPRTSTAVFPLLYIHGSSRWSLFFISVFVTYKMFELFRKILSSENLEHFQKPSYPISSQMKLGKYSPIPSHPMIPSHIPFHPDLWPSDLRPSAKTLEIISSVFSFPQHICPPPLLLPVVWPVWRRLGPKPEPAAKQLCRFLLFNRYQHDRLTRSYWPLSRYCPPHWTPTPHMPSTALVVQ